MSNFDYSSIEADQPCTDTGWSAFLNLVAEQAGLTTDGQYLLLPDHLGCGQYELGVIKIGKLYVKCPLLQNPNIKFKIELDCSQLNIAINLLDYSKRQFHQSFVFGLDILSRVHNSKSELMSLTLVPETHITDNKTDAIQTLYEMLFRIYQDTKDFLPKSSLLDRLKVNDNCFLFLWYYNKLKNHGHLLSFEKALQASHDLIPIIESNFEQTLFDDNDYFNEC